MAQDRPHVGDRLEQIGRGSLAEGVERPGGDGDGEAEGDHRRRGHDHQHRAAQPPTAWGGLLGGSLRQPPEHADQIFVIENRVSRLTSSQGTTSA